MRRGRTVLVTAGAGNVGRHLVAGFLATESRVVAADINRARLEELTQDFPGVETVEADVATSEGADRAIAAAGAELGVLCNNAALIETATAEQLDEELWHRVLGVNLTGAFLMSKRALPIMLARGHGVIINTGSIASLRGGRGGAAYTASKYGLIGLTQNIAAEYGSLGVRCNAVCPGSIARPPGAPPPVIEQTNPDFVHRGSAPISPADIAALIIYLAQDVAKSINGVAIPVDAGVLAT